jgi:aspartate racemase
MHRDAPVAAGDTGAMTPLHIGIAACSAEGAALCYRTICTEAPAVLGRHDHPEVTMHTPSLGEYMEHIYRGDWQAVGGMMLASAEKLARVGADFVICPDNTIHQALPFVEARSPLPWLHIAACVADEARSRGFARLGLTGTRWLVESEVYPQKLDERGIGWTRPQPDEREEINRIIMDELVRGVLKPGQVDYFRKVMDRLKSQGCDAVVLGCTEIPLIMNDGNAPLPTLDSTRLLARAALERAIAGAAKAA